MKIRVEVREITQRVRVYTFKREDGRVVRVHECVVRVPCSHCRSRVGEPCRGAHGHKGDTHYVRREAWQRKKQAAAAKARRA